MSRASHSSEPVIEVVGDEPLTDAAIAALASLLLHVVEKENDEGNQITENEICRAKDAN